MSERTPYNFSPQTKIDTLNSVENGCEHCLRDEKLYIHHLIAVWFAREAKISPDLIKSKENACAICGDCHNELHLQENRHQYAYLAYFLFGIDVEADEKKDKWRKDPNHPINRKR